MECGFTKINRGIWDAKVFRRLPSDDARLCFLYLLTAPGANKSNGWSVSFSDAVRDLGWEPPRMVEALNALASAGLTRHAADLDAGWIVHVMEWLGCRRYGRSGHSRPGRWLPKALRDFIFSRDKHRCTYCGAEESLQVDHVFPASRGGTDHPNNLTTACKPCNTSKGPKTVEEWQAAKGLAANG